MIRTRTLALSLAILSLTGGVVAGCGSNKDQGFRRDNSAIDGDPSTPLPASLASTTTTTATTPGSPKAGQALPRQRNVSGVSTNLSKKPKIARITGTAPKVLQGSDVVVGKGPSAKSGDNLTVKYVGVLFKGGKQFDASWDRKPSTFPLTLGQGDVIQGWDQGLVGMRAGGRRVLVIPPDLGYGSSGSGSAIPPNAPLVFVVDLEKIG